MEPDELPAPPRYRGYLIAIALVLAAMVALAAWAWWIPEGAFNSILAWVKSHLIWLKSHLPSRR